MVGATVELDGVQIEVLSVRKRSVEMARLTFKMESGTP